jgi:hypothetical protein
MTTRQDLPIYYSHSWMSLFLIFGEISLVGLGIILDNRGSPMYKISSVPLSDKLTYDREARNCC